jgi:hypothetical protein
MNIEEQTQPNNGGKSKKDRETKTSVFYNTIFLYEKHHNSIIEDLDLNLCNIDVSEDNKPTL